MIIAILIVGSVILGLFLRENRGDDVYFSVAIGAPAAISLFGFLLIGSSLGERWSLNAGGIRNAIAVTTVTVFFTVFTVSLFLTGGPDRLPLITQAVLQNFTWMVTVVIAFYFASSAYVQAKENGESNKDEEPTKKD